MPMPPMPKITTVSPGETFAVFTAEPQPVGTPQPTSTALSSGRSSSTLTQEAWWMTPYWLNVPSMHIAPYWPPGPEMGNLGPGSEPSSVLAPRSQMDWRPVAQYRQTPQAGTNEHTT